MGFLDDFMDCKIADKNSKLNYTPIKIDKSKVNNGIVEGVKNIYYNNSGWCLRFKNTDIYCKCVTKILNKIEDLIGVPCVEIPNCIDLEWAEDYWYEEKNIKKYNQQQLKRIEKELKYKAATEICHEMIENVWYDMIKLQWIDKELDEDMVFKLYRKYNT